MQSAKGKKKAKRTAKASKKQSGVGLKANVASGLAETRVTAEMDALVLAATLGYARLNTVEGSDGVLVRFGRYNPRGVNQTTVRSLVSYFDASGKQAGRERLPAMIKADWVDPMSLVQNPATPLAEDPRARFLPVAKGHTIDLLGGQHRSVAGAKWRDQLDAERARQESQKKKAESKKKTEEVQQIDGLLERLGALRTESVMWLVQFLDESKSFRTR